jgi:PTH1 family peptidyl-tRNA hydrolase
MLETDGLQVRYIVPDTYMNLSGEYIKKKLKNAKDDRVLILIYDDIDIAMGEVKISFARSSGGHNGVQSVIDALGTADFYRVRVGIGGKSNPNMLLQDYVLSLLSESEIVLLKTTVRDKVLDAVKEIIKNCSSENLKLS